MLDKSSLYMLYYLLVFVVPLISFALQIWPRLIKRYFGVDTWRHLMYADYVRTHKCLPKKITEHYITNVEFGYPPFLLVLLSLFPKKFTQKYQFVFSPALDFIHNVFIYIVVFAIVQNAVVAISAQLIAAFTPIVIIEASNLNTRILSYLLFSISFFSLLLFSAYGNILWLILASVFLVILFFTHRFGLQAYAFNVIGFSIIEKNPFYVIFFIVIFGLVYLFGGNTYKAVFKEHIGSLKYWAKNIDRKFGHQFGQPAEKDKRSDFINKLYVLSMKLPFFYILGENPWIGILSIIYLANIFGILRTETVLPYAVFIKLIEWIIFSVIAAFFVLSVKNLRFLGEGYRYIEYTIFPVAIVLGSLTAYFLVTFGNLFIIIFSLIILINFIAIIFMQYKTIIQDRHRTITKEKWDVINYLNNHEGDRVRLAIFPIQQGDGIMYFIKGKVLTSDSLVGMQKLLDIYPVVKKPMDEIVRQFNLNYIFFDKKYVGIKEMKLRKYKIIIDENDYVLLKVI